LQLQIENIFKEVVELKLPSVVVWFLYRCGKWERDGSCGV
jgi:hypothetical protein